MKRQVVIDNKLKMVECDRHVSDKYASRWLNDKLGQRVHFEVGVTGVTGMVASVFGGQVYVDTDHGERVFDIADIIDIEDGVVEVGQA